MNYETTIQQLYLTYYGRAADPGGQEYWVTQLGKAGGDLDAIINAFGNSPEYQSKYGELSEQELIDIMYLQAFDRHADEEGMEYYLWRLERGLSTFPEIAWDIAAGAQDEDLTTLDLHVSLAELFTATIVEYEKSQGVKYSGDEASGVVRGFFTNVIDYKDTVYSGVLAFRKVIEGLGYEYKLSNDADPRNKHVPQVQFDQERYGPIQYEWNSLENTLTAYSRGDDVLETITVFSNGIEIASGSFEGRLGEVTINLEQAYQGTHSNFGPVTGFDGNERFAYISTNEYTFTFTDVNGDIIEESYFLIVNKGLNLLGDALETDRREMILNGERDAGATAGDNSGNRDVWFSTNDDGIDPDRFYAASLKDWGNKDQWVMMEIGIYAEGTEDNPLFLSFNNGDISTLRAVMTVPGVYSDESSVTFYDGNDVEQGTATVVHYKNIALGGSGAPGVSLLYGNDLENMLESYGAEYIAYGMAGDDVFRGDKGNSWIDGGEDYDTYNFRFDSYNGTHIEIDLLDIVQQSDLEGNSMGDFVRGQLINLVGTLNSTDWLKDIEQYVGAASNDILYGSNASDDLHGGEKTGDDYIDGRDGDDYLVGGAGSDTILGGDGDDAIYGGHDNTTNLDFPGGGDYIGWIEDGKPPIIDGDDTITGGDGQDTLTGGTGADKFTYAKVTEFGDTILDFNSGTYMDFGAVTYISINPSTFDTVVLNVGTTPPTNTMPKITNLFTSATSVLNTQQQFALNILNGGGHGTAILSAATINLATGAASISVSANFILDSSGAGFDSVAAFRSALRFTNAASNQTYIAFGLGDGGELYQAVIKNGAGTDVTLNEITTVNTIATLNGLTNSDNLMLILI